jgi:hypothetical protein
VSSWGDTEDERRRRLEERAMRNYREAMTGGGGGSRSPGPYHLSMYAGLVTFTALGWRIAVELGRIRKRLT